CDVHIVFETYAEFSTDVDSRLVAGCHVRHQLRRIPSNEIGPFVAIHAKAVPDAVREELVVGTETGFGDDLARGRIHGTAVNTGPSGCQSSGLRLVHDVEDAFHLVRRLTQDEGAGDLRLISLDRAAVVEHDDRALANHLRSCRSMRRGSVLTDHHTRVAYKSCPRVR